ncbi:DUF4339 domain-containing protein [Pontibacter roseus]|uniref:DUF4339 domain-containing protein n=1 Tax=Pontibacter roseus TaxID=336989 RepID=UPI0003760F1D|nr:DUF4339 domain-containing protein [Pontibacter roseus]
MERYYFIVEGEQRGPFTFDEVQSMKINRGTLIWREGLKDWVQAGQLKELSSSLIGFPPPIPSNILEKDRTYNINLGVRKPEFKRLNITPINTAISKTKIAKELLLISKLFIISISIGVIVCLVVGAKMYIDAKKDLTDLKKLSIDAGKEYIVANQAHIDYDAHQFAIERKLNVVTINQTLSYQKSLFDKYEREIEQFGKNDDDRIMFRMLSELNNGSSYSIYTDFTKTKSNLYQKAENLYQQSETYKELYNSKNYELENFFEENIEKALNFILIIVTIVTIIICFMRYMVKGLGWISYYSRQKI